MDRVTRRLFVPSTSIAIPTLMLMFSLAGVMPGAAFGAEPSPVNGVEQAVATSSGESNESSIRQVAGTSGSSPGLFERLTSGGSDKPAAQNRSTHAPPQRGLLGSLFSRNSSSNSDNSRGATTARPDRRQAMPNQP